ncbi:hypothetical protein PCA20602_03834 [Pandoraea capi]|uniref:Uncharacterized protein n=1 Tax=Pandoraea capi TaxID=2508286 RepID=A0ABY6W737_9BURK|nr:hypothetical protein [Pandoraea capi]VVE34503.1 hypothetical protein PCA20602_03834 [Pandoraea capi]
MPATLPNALTTHTFAPNRLDSLDGLANATSHDTRYDIARFNSLSTRACAMLDEPPEAQPALGLMLRLTEQGIPVEDLSNDGVWAPFAGSSRSDLACTSVMSARDSCARARWSHRTTRWKT